MIELVGVYGASGCGRGILPIMRAELAGKAARLVFIDDAPFASHVNGHEVLAWNTFLAQPHSVKSACLAVANSKVREALAVRCTDAGVFLRQARAASVVQMDEVKIGEGAMLSPFVTLTSNIRIGRCFHANLYSYVEHDCVIGS